MSERKKPVELLRIGAWPAKSSVIESTPSDLFSLVEWVDLALAPEMANVCAGILVASSVDRVEELSSGWPLNMPVSDAAALQNAAKRDAFFERAIGRANVERLFSPNWTIADLVAFNIRERYRILVHDPKQHRLMGRLIAKAKDHPRERLEVRIKEHYLGALAKPVTPRKHASLFAHVLELLEDRIDERAGDAIDLAIAEFIAGHTSLLRPLDRLAAEVTRLRVAGLEAQSYLYPDEVERSLRFGRGA